MSDSGKPTAGAIRIRSNVTNRQDATDLIPPEYVQSLASGSPLSPHQKSELDYRKKCAICARNSFQINDEGCDHPICRGNGTKPQKGR